LIPFLLALILSTAQGDKAEYIIQGFDGYTECADSRAYFESHPYMTEDKKVWHVDYAICTKEKIT
jgi:hypothetical protein